MNETKELFKLDKNIDISKEIYPTFKLSNLDEGNSVKFKILDDKPKEVEIEKNGKKEIALIINVYEELTEGVYTLWLSPITLRMGLAKIYEKYKTLKNKEIKITAFSKDGKHFYDVVEVYRLKK